MARNRSEQKRTPESPQSPAASDPAGPRDRDALERSPLAESERRATTQEPQNFRDKANADKVVEIGPDRQDQPIQGIDPVERGRPER